MKNLGFALCALGLAACGGPGSFDGSVGGKTLDVSDAQLLEQTTDGGVSALVLLSSVSGVCDKLGTNKEPQGVALVSLILGNIQGDKLVAPTPGTYNIVSGNGLPSGQFASAAFLKNKDGSCESEVQQAASSGTVTVESYDSKSGAKGTFSLNFAQGDKVTGSFDAARCNAAVASGESTCE